MCSLQVNSNSNKWVKDAVEIGSHLACDNSYNANEMALDSKDKAAFN